MDRNTLLEEIKSAMRAHDKARLSILRQVNGELTNIEVDERREVTDEDVVAMFKRVIKQTKETLDGSRKAGTDAARTELLALQVSILEEYLPAQLSGAALEELARSVIAEGGYSEKRDMGKVMGELNARTGGNLDKAEAARVVGGLLA